MNKGIHWYFLRLKAMSLNEIVQRTKSLLIKKYIKNRASWIAPIPKFSDSHRDWWQLSTSSLENNSEYVSLIQEAQNYLQGSYIWLNIPQQEVPLNWHQDPQTGKIAPLKFGLDINYRDPNLVGNVKNIWEKNRHHHLTVMSAAYALTKDEKYATAVAQQLQDWITDNPFPLGVNWNSSLELGIRLISWVWIDRLLRGSPVHDQLFGQSGLLWSSIYWHQWLISKYYSHGSSANNHLVGEMAGLFISSCHWSVFASSKDWQALSWNILEREISQQTFPSGLNREQAFPYHIFSTEFFLLAGIEAQMRGINVSEGYLDLARKMLEIIPPLVDVKGNLPNYGDGDEGMALQIRPHQSSRLDWLFRLGRQWLKASIPLPHGESGYLGASLINIPLEDTVQEVPTLADSLPITDAGLYVFSRNKGTPQEILCIADAGDLGFLSIAAHGHADALSFTLNIGGTPIIVDPGTYVYHANDYWHHYFRSTKAHNTISVDDLDQSKPEGTFLWSKQAKSKVLDWKAKHEQTVLLAEHDGYTYLPQEIVHRRKLTLDLDGLEIIDDLQGSGLHKIEWRLHFSPQCTVNLEEGNCIVKWHSGSLVIALDDQMDWSLLTGELTGGWYSSGFNLKQPITTLQGITKIDAGTSFKNFLNLQNCHQPIEVTDSIAG